MNIAQLLQLKETQPGIETLYPGVTIVGGEAAQIVNFPATAPRFQLAREFATAGCLTQPSAIALANTLHAKHGSYDDISPLDWNEVGIAEGLPEYEPEPPEVTDNRRDAIHRAGASDTVLTQSFVDTVNHVLAGALAQNNFERSVNNYTLLEGDAGAAKSKAINYAAAVLQRPQYTFECANQSPDLIKENLDGSLAIVSQVSKAAKDLAYIGCLSDPRARRTYIDTLAQANGNFEAISHESWEKIGKIEGLREATTYFRPGIAVRARKFGGILNLEEINTLNKDSLTILNRILDVYLDRHPNFYIAASQNPASREYDNRAALTPDIRNRFSNSKDIPPISREDLITMVTGIYTGTNPTIKVGNKKAALTCEYFGIPMRNVTPSPNLLAAVTPTSVTNITSAIVDTFLELKKRIDNGSLNPSISGHKRVDELRTISFRNLSAMRAIFTSELAPTIVSSVPASTTYAKNPWNIPTSNVYANLPAKPIVNAIVSAANKALCTPLDFLANDISGNASSKRSEGRRTSEIIQEIFKNNKLSLSTLEPLVTAQATIDKPLKEFVKLFEGKGVSLSAPAAAELLEKKAVGTPLRYANSVIMVDNTKKAQQVSATTTLDNLISDNTTYLPAPLGTTEDIITFAQSARDLLAESLKDPNVHAVILPVKTTTPLHNSEGQPVDLITRKEQFLIATRHLETPGKLSIGIQYVYSNTITNQELGLASLAGPNSTLASILENRLPKPLPASFNIQTFTAIEIDKSKFKLITPGQSR